MTVKVTVIIPTYQSPLSLDNLLQGLSNLQKVEQLQVICINNIKKKYRPALNQKWAPLFYNFKYINADMRGVNSARNIGIKYALGDILWFLDDDCILANNIKSVDQIIKLHGDDPSYVGIGGFYLKPTNLKRHNLAYFQIAHHWFKQNISPNADTTMLLGGSASYKRDIFERGYLFDSDILFGGSEKYFNEELIKSGYKLKVDPTLNVYHHVSMSLITFFSKAYKQGHTKALKRDQTLENIDLKKSSINRFYQKLYMTAFQWGKNHNLPFHKKITVSFIDIYAYQDTIILFKNAYHYLFPQVVSLFYIIRNTAQIPYFKIYHMSKYHIETYLIPTIKKMRKRV